ncbi:MAG: LysE family translocator [Gammaproteobacteria bacterium]|nr:LysE family translocator [Gammaproteobacteria bacterium]
MTDLFPSWPLLTAFVTASLLLAVTPGPGVLYIVTRSLAQGRNAGLASVAGVAVGNLVNAIGAAVGLAALFSVSSAAFLVVKYLGAAYLVYLGIRALTRASSDEAPAEIASRAPRVFRDGLWVAILNPKTTLFFAAFLPQFMDAGANPMLQGISLGLLFVVIAAVTDSVYAIAAGTLGPAIGRGHRFRRMGRWLSGATFIGLGLFAALGGPDGRRMTTSG